LEDLISIGTIGLIKAVGTYRTDKNIKLATYASRCIENEILMYLRKNAARKGEVSYRRAAEHGLGRQRAAALRRAGHGGGHRHAPH
jgi:RNA polymerase sigma factor (sigma-70 family)